MMATETGSFSALQKRLVLVCVDSSEHSVDALDWYFYNLHQKEFEVGLVHVHVLPDIPHFGLFGKALHDNVKHVNFFKDGESSPTLYSQHLIQESVEKSKSLVEREKERCILKGVTPKIFIETKKDSIGHTICDIAKQNNAFMILIGQRGLGVVRRTLFGSVSGYVLHHAHIPVTVMPSCKKD